MRERVLYHQIHPLKLLVDWSSGFVAAYLFWQHQLVLALAIGLLPPPLVTAVVLRWANLEPYAQSRFGRYIKRYMTHLTEIVRLVGAAVTWIGAWYHSWLAVGGGVVIILLAWARGLISR